MLHFKLQMGCMLILLYVIFLYVKDGRRYTPDHKFSLFDGLLLTSVISLFFDGSTAYMVNHLDEVNATLNIVFHALFLFSLDVFIFLLALYMLSITGGMPEKSWQRILLSAPFAVNAVVVLSQAPNLVYHTHEVSNYSMGLSAYTCFIMVAIYTIFTIGVVIVHWKLIEKHKRVSVLTYMLIMAAVAAYQMVNAHALVTSMCVTIIILGIYINQENPAVKELERYHKEMVMGFATLVENKDGSTGGHIKRTTMYVELLTEELRKRGYYKDILTKDYMNHLYNSAPMHDIGKIAVPDLILQKPGKLTVGEFESMKFHTINGGKIIHETFEHLGNDEYATVAYQVACFHHEKWNGKGYPNGLKGEEIPLCARIMSIADVFDAVSMKRCYRDALPLEECFEIIKNGRGEDFEPLLVDIFLDIRDKVEAAHHSTKEE